MLEFSSCERIRRRPPSGYTVKRPGVGGFDRSADQKPYQAMVSRAEKCGLTLITNERGLIYSGRVKPKAKAASKARSRRKPK